MKRVGTKILAAATLLSSSCNGLFQTENQGILQICFPDEVKLYTKSSAIPEPNDFIIDVTGTEGENIFHGNYGDTPDQLFLKSGTYKVSAKSCEFSEPVFERPQYGDNQIVKVSAGNTTTVNLACYQLNCGIQLKISPNFLTAFPNGVLYLKSSEGKLMYSYNEKRTAYFKPGSISLVLNDSGKESTLLSRTLLAQQMLVLSLAASEENGTGCNGISISVDTCRTWITDNFILGGDNKGDDIANAYTISQAKAHIGESDVWVQGYIVGGDLSSSRCSFEGPFQSRTNIVIASKSACTNKESCLSVQLSKGDIRDALNLVDNEGNLKRAIYIKGDIVESYYGIPGIQSITEWQWKQ